MGSIASNTITKPVRGLGLNPHLIGFHFTTDAGGVPTLGFDDNGGITIAEDSGEYTVTVGSWATTISCVHSVRYEGDASEEPSVFDGDDDVDIVLSASDGTLVVSGLPNSAANLRVDVLLVCSSD